MSVLNLQTSQITKTQRWLKLYRTIFNLFLKRDFVHRKDYELMMQQMNTRITAVETNATTALSGAVSALSSMVAAHTHTVATAGSPAAQTGATTSTVAVAPQLPPTPKVPPIKTADTFAQTQDAAQMSTGPAIAPLSQSFSAAGAKSNMDIMMDIGF